MELSGYTHTRDFLKRLDLREAVARAIRHTHWGRPVKHRDLELILWADGVGDYTLCSLILMDTKTGLFSEVETFLWLKGGEHMLKFVFGNVIDGIDQISKPFGYHGCIFTITGIIDIGDHHLQNILCGIGAGRSTYRDIRGFSLVHLTDCLPYHHWNSVWTQQERMDIFGDLNTKGVNDVNDFRTNFAREPSKACENYFIDRNGRTITFKCKEPTKFSATKNPIRIVSLCPRFHNNFHRVFMVIGMYLNHLAPLLDIDAVTLLNTPLRKNEKGDMVASFQGATTLLDYLQRLLTPLMHESDNETIKAFAHGFTLCMALVKMENILQLPGKPIKDMKLFSQQYETYSYFLQMLMSQFSATFGHKKSGTPYLNTIYAIDMLIHMFRELCKFPNLVKVNERLFEASLKHMREFINTSHGHLDQLTDYLNRLEVRRKLSIRKKVESGNSAYSYDFYLPNIVEYASIAAWRYPSSDVPIGLPTVPTLKRGFLTELVHHDRADSVDLLFADTKSKTTHYMIGEKKGETIIINPKPQLQVGKIPALIFATNSRTLDTELKQIWDCVDKKGKRRLRLRNLMPMLIAARVDTFMKATREELIDLGHYLFEIFEVDEVEGSITWKFFKALAIHYSTPKLSPEALNGIDVASVMEMVGLPLSRSEKKLFHQPVTKTKLSFLETFKVYDHVRNYRMQQMKQIASETKSLQKLCQQRIDFLLGLYHEQQNKRRTFKATRYQRALIIACRNLASLSGLNVDLPAID